ncbi:MAG TPA: hypothetical protein VL463_27800 [Kofleriaceae bacterium]|nr:hypothetical protein [Kofleriaceae bacterium]
MKKLLIACLLVGGAAHAQPTPEPAPTPAPAPAPVVTPAPVVVPAPVVITEPAPAPPPPAPKPEDPVPVVGKWSPQLYGFMQLLSIWDSTQSFTEQAGNGAIAKDGTYAGDRGRSQISARHSRVGFKLKAPEYDGIKTSAQVEFDFFGNQPPGTSEASFYSNATPRLRHYFMKMESSTIDLLFGQTWQLFGWQGFAHPSTVEIQGVPGQPYGRVQQMRASKTIKSDAWALDLAAAASRPANRNSVVPDFEAGVRFTAPKWTAWRTAGATGQSLDAGGLGVSGIVRQLRVVDFANAAQNDHATGWGVSIDALVPVIGATKEKHAGALTLTGSFVLGQGIADQFSGLSGGATFPAPMAPATYTPDIDNGLVTFDTTGALTAIKWQSIIAGAQWYASSKAWLSVNYSQMSSSNIGSLGLAPGKVFSSSRWADANVFYDVTPAMRVGAEYEYFMQHYEDGAEPVNHRLQLTALYIF